MVGQHAYIYICSVKTNGRIHMFHNSFHLPTRPVLDKVFTQVPDIELVDNFLVFVVILCKFDLDLPVAVFKAMVFEKKYFPTGSIFSSNLQTCKYRVFFGKNVVIKMPRGWISRLKKSHDLEICTRPTCLGIVGDGVRKKNIFRPEVTNF